MTRIGPVDMTEAASAKSILLINFFVYLIQQLMARLYFLQFVYQRILSHLFQKNHF
jgi:hypothetical protein